MTTGGQSAFALDEIDRMRLTLRASFALLIWATPAAGQDQDSLAITARELGARLRFLSSDLFEGGTPVLAAKR